MSTREEIRKQILGIDNFLSSSYGLSQETIENLEKDKKDRQDDFQKVCDNKIEEIFNAIEVMEGLQKNADTRASENYRNSIEDFKREIVQIEGELQDMKLSTAKIQEWGNRRQEKETGETEKEEPQAEQQNPEQEEVEEPVVVSEQENKEPDTSVKQPRQSRNRLVRAFQSLVKKLGKILGIRKGIEAELEARNIDLNKMNAEELENKTQEVEQGTSQQPETNLPIKEAENRQEMQPEQMQQDAAEPEKTTQTQSPKQTIIGRFKQIMAYRARVRALEKSINKQLRKRNLEHWIEDKKEMAHKKWENAKDSVVHSKVVQGANDIKEDIGHRITDKKVWLEQNMSDTKEKVVESAKETGTIVLAFGVMSIEAIGKAREAFQAVSAQTIQNVVNYGRDTANAVLDKFQENVQTREEKVLEKSEKAKKTEKSEMMEDYLEMA